MKTYIKLENGNIGVWHYFKTTGKPKAFYVYGHLEKADRIMQIRAHNQPEYSLTGEEHDEIEKTVNSNIEVMKRVTSENFETCHFEERGGVFIIYILFPRITITNSSEQTHDITDLWVSLHMNPYTLKLTSMGGARTSVSSVEFENYFFHPHLIREGLQIAHRMYQGRQTSIIDIDSNKNRFCLGETYGFFMNHVNEESFDLMLQTLKDYVANENSGGGPYFQIAALDKSTNIGDFAFLDSTRALVKYDIQLSNRDMHVTAYFDKEDIKKIDKRDLVLKIGEQYYSLCAIDGEPKRDCENIKGIFVKVGRKKFPLTIYQFKRTGIEINEENIFVNPIIIKNINEENKSRFKEALYSLSTGRENPTYYFRIS